jgi:phage terminase large subunit-like protein
MADVQSVLSPAALDAYRRDQVRRARELSAARVRGGAGATPAGRSTWTGDDVIAWIESEFYIPELHGPMPVAPYHRRFIQELERRDSVGRYVYDLGLLSDIKKSAKSCLAAAIILFRALNTEHGSFKVVANDLKQADSRVFFYIRRALSLNKALGARAAIKNYKIALDNQSVIEAIPVDPKGEAGGSDDLIEFTELHAAESKAALAMWSEMTLSPLKAGYSQRIIDTYAGHSGESPLLEPLYHHIVKPENRIDGEIELYASGGQLALWNTEPRQTWQTPDYYAREALTLSPSEFQRLHRNQWVTSENVFVPGEWWDNCKGDMPSFDARTPVIIGVDAGVSSDCFAVVGVSRIGDTTYVRFTYVWKPSKNNKVDFAEPEQTIRDLVKRYNVQQICYDPSQLHDMTTRFIRDALTWIYEFKQGGPRLLADKQLYDQIRDKRIVHDGDPVLAEHVKNANSQADPQDHSLRIVKRAEHLKIDACVALSMCNSEARRLLIS